MRRIATHIAWSDLSVCLCLLTTSVNHAKRSNRSGCTCELMRVKGIRCIRWGTEYPPTGRGTFRGHTWAIHQKQQEAMRPCVAINVAACYTTLRAQKTKDNSKR